MANIFRYLIITYTMLTLIATAQAGESIILASTTSAQNSGLFRYILPKFTAQTGIEVRVVAQGTGQAMETGRRGDADVLLVHNRKAEEAFVAEGFGIERRDVMYNDFVLIGPQNDPAKIREATGARNAFTRIADTGSLFISRGDASGTHTAELHFWHIANLDPKTSPGYRESGSGMGATLNMAAGLGAYTLADRGTWLSFKNRQDLNILFSGDPEMFNPYGIMLVNPARHPHVKKEAGMTLIRWITSSAGRAIIAGYKINGEQLFFPYMK